MKYWRLIIIWDAWYDKHRKKRVVCLCDCGNQKTISYSSLKRWITKSCGCFRKEISRQRARSHGKSTHPTYTIWQWMNARCYNKHSYQYKDYGWRWITIEWDSYESFYQDMWPTYIEWYSIERIDINGNYNKENCTWIPRKHQAYNTRNSIRITINGQTKCLTQICNERWLVYERIRQRITKLWWDPIEAILKW